MGTEYCEEQVAAEIWGNARFICPDMFLKWVSRHPKCVADDAACVIHVVSVESVWDAVPAAGYEVHSL